MLRDLKQFLNDYYQDLIVYIKDDFHVNNYFTKTMLKIKICSSYDNITRTKYINQVLLGNNI